MRKFRPIRASRPVQRRIERNCGNEKHLFSPAPASRRRRLGDGRVDVTREYEIHSGRWVVSIQRSVSELQAVVDYVRMFGSAESEIRIVGIDAVSWRGARFTAVPVRADDQVAA